MCACVQPGNMFNLRGENRNYFFSLVSLDLTELSFASQSVKMAGRRVALKAIDWVAFAERIPPNQRGMFNALKTRSDGISAK